MENKERKYRGEKIMAKKYKKLIRQVGIVGYKHFCGYVSIPETHPFYEVHYDDLPYLEIHGGITFSGYIGSAWYIGFDCMHGDDYSAVNPLGKKWTYDEVSKELDNLIEQIKEYERILRD